MGLFDSGTLKKVGIGIAVGAGAAVAGQQIAKSKNEWVDKHWYAVPVIGAGGALLLAKKHPMLAAAVAGAAGLVGYLQYQANKEAEAQKQKQGTQPPSTTGAWNRGAFGGSMRGLGPDSGLVEHTPAGRVHGVERGLPRKQTGSPYPGDTGAIQGRNAPAVRATRVDGGVMGLHG